MKKPVLLCLTLVFFNSVVWADESPKSPVTRYIELGISQLETRMQDSREGLKNTKRDPERQKFYRGVISRLEEERRAHTYMVSLPRSRPLEIGDIGRLIAGRMTVFQVLDASNVLATVEWYLAGRERVGNELVPTQVYKEELVWIQGLDTSKMVDKRLYKTTQVFDVVSNKMYQTSSGSKTVVLLELRDGIEEQAKIVGASRYPVESSKTAPTAVPVKKGYRTWVSADGKYRLVGKLISGNSTEIVLEKEDGAQITVSLAVSVKRRFSSR